MIGLVALGTLAGLAAAKLSLLFLDVPALAALGLKSLVGCAVVGLLAAAMHRSRMRAPERDRQGSATPSRTPTTLTPTDSRA